MGNRLSTWISNIRLNISVLIDAKDITEKLISSPHFSMAWHILEDLKFNAISYDERSSVNSQLHDFSVRVNGKNLSVINYNHEYGYDFSLSYNSTNSPIVMIRNNKSKKTPDVIAKEILLGVVELSNKLIVNSGRRPINFDVSYAVGADKQIMTYWKLLRKYGFKELHLSVLNDGSYCYVATLIINGQNHNIETEKKHFGLTCTYDFHVINNIPFIHTELGSESLALLKTIKNDLRDILKKAYIINQQ